MVDNKNLATIGNVTRVKGNLLAGRRISELALRRGSGLFKLLCNSTIIVQNISKTNFRTSGSAGSIAGSHTIGGSNQNFVERDKFGVAKCLHARTSLNADGAFGDNSAFDRKLGLLRVTESDDFGVTNTALRINDSAIVGKGRVLQVLEAGDKGTVIKVNGVNNENLLNSKLRSINSQLNHSSLKD